ncbi:flagellar biosynthetic protein [Enterobacter cloacae]|nr:hypothetical protein ECL_03290 [Enterobacter cloacae subsp. cloacae ATCC 13047]KGB11602.1 bacterial export s, 1 family protein [Enterobacter cloacae]CUI50640.1 flagellar biosynthesis protein FliR [Enterobacter cloacae]STQ10834.1 flagellar biosynthetic protein [Enterobacter cloacae]
MAFGLPLDQLYGLVSHYFFIMVRIAALLHVAPVFGEKAVSARLRAGLALLIAILIGGTLPDAQVGLYAW